MWLDSPSSGRTRFNRVPYLPVDGLTIAEPLRSRLVANANANARQTRVTWARVTPCFLGTLAVAQASQISKADSNDDGMRETCSIARQVALVLNWNSYVHFPVLSVCFTPVWNERDENMLA